MAGRFDALPLTPSVARLIIKEFIDEQQLWKKRSIDDRVQQIHRSEGGITGKQDLSTVVKRALQDLQAEGFVTNHFQHWKRCGVDEVEFAEGTAQAVEDFSQSPDDAEIVDEIEVVVEREVGIGSETVYLYFNPNDKKLACLEGRSTWECKIGKTTVADRLARVLTLRTALSHQPVVGLVIKTSDASAVEKALHSALRLIDATIPDSPGAEWFMTSPLRVENWWNCFEHSLAALVEESSGNFQSPNST